MASQYALLKPVESSMFSRAGYDEERWELLFEFRSTKEVRAYRDITPEMAEEILTCKSLGSYYNQNIKGNSSWPFEVLGADPAEKKPEPKPAQVVEGGITDDDIRTVDPNWKGDDYGSRTGVTPLDDLHMNTLPDRSLAKQPQGEVLPAWEPPKTATEAIKLTVERKSEIDAIVKQSVQRSEQALTIRVTDQATHASAGEALKEITMAKDRAMAMLDPFRALLYDAYVVANNHKKAAVEPLEAGAKHISRELNAWEAEQERIRRQRIMEEQQRAEEESRRLQQEQSQQLTLAEIDDALQSGDTQKAEELASKPIEVPRPYVAPAVIAPTITKPKGQGTRANWKVNEETADMVKFLTAVKAGSLDIAVAAKYLKFDFPALNKMAKAQQEAFSVPGLDAWDDTVRSVRRGS